MPPSPEKIICRSTSDAANEDSSSTSFGLVGGGLEKKI